MLRERYLGTLKKLRGLDIIKVLTGARGVGKSTVMRQLADGLRASGVPEGRIVYLDFEGPDVEVFSDYMELCGPWPEPWRT